MDPDQQAKFAIHAAAREGRSKLDGPPSSGLSAVLI